MGAAEEELKEEEREEDGVVAREEEVVRVSAAEEEDVDVSPNGNSLASLARTPRDLALRFKNMYVYDNSFSVLPEGLRLYKELRKLKYWSNDVKVLPDEIGDLTQLEEVYLKFSAPSGLASLPPLAKLRGLRALELHQAPVLPSSATLTRDIAQLRSLSKLSVCHFSISWIPAEIGSLKNLEELDLSFNKLRALPKEIAGLRALKSLRVASNKLVELPSELSELPNLTSIDVAHNRLTSFENLGLESMSSLRALNAQFNKLQTIGQIPDWVCCQLEGNAMLEATIYGVEAENISCEDDYPQDCEVSPTSLVVKVNEPLCLSTKGNSPNQKVSINLKSRRGWRKQENQQYKARQDRLNNSRKHRNDDFSVSNEEVLVRKAKTNLSVEVDELPCETACADENIMDLQQPSDSECDVVGTGRDGCGEMTRNSAPAKQELNSRIHSEDSSCFDESNSNSGKLGGGSSGGKADSLAEPKDEGYHSDLDRRNLKDKNRSRKAISGDRSSVNDDDKSSVDSEGGMGKVTNSGVSVTSVGVKDEERLRRSGSGTEENPHPSKRRRSRPGFSEISYKYYTESFCGFSERLLDGFYDAGRDRPFSSLEDLEKEQPSFNSREVILVDRKRDEDLHDIALSAEQLLGRLGSPLTKSGEEKKRHVTMDTFQRITVLALFVSDCFGGSDKTLNVRNMRRTAFGGTAGTPFVCSCSSSLSLGSANAFADGGLGSPPGAALPSVHSLCEDAVKYLKAQRGSNVLPLGSLRFGVCRHRAILLKYLCDRADPVIPCELVRGYLDYMPHAWNVILVEDDKSSVRVLVDACRPLDIRHESDPEYFCRYIPLKRLLFPSASVGDHLSSKSVSSLVLFEKIGQGASGASVHRCKFGELTAAAKVRQLDGVAEGLSGKGPESSSLSELRIFCSLGKHPCLVSLYGHQFASQLDSGSQLIIYMEHVRGGSLEGVIKDLVRDGKEFMPPRLACQVARNIACALGMLHSKGILHRDVKSSNVLVDLDSRQGLDGGPVVKLCDFDRAVPLSSSAAHTCYLAHRGVPPLDVCVGTPRWFAPEVLQAMYERHAYGLEADVWSFGCLVAELLTLRVPYAGYQDSEVISSIRMGQRPRISAELENLLAQPFSDKKQRADDDTEILRVLVELFRSCTKANPSHRPTMKEVFEKLSEVSRTTSTSVDPPFEKDAGDESSNADAVEPDVLKPLAEEAVQAADEAELPCSCGGKKCSQCESNGAQEAEST